LQLLQTLYAFHASLFGSMLLNYELFLAMNGDKTTFFVIMPDPNKGSRSLQLLRFANGKFGSSVVGIA
jgi:hypothetical protein